jgi:hypothetical protein
MQKIIKLASACLLISLLASCNKDIKSTKGYAECTKTTNDTVCMAWSKKECTNSMVQGLVKKVIKMEKPPKPCSLTKDYAALVKKGITKEQIQELKNQAIKLSKKLT